MPTVGAPGANSRGRGGKFKKYTRGGGKHYSRDLRPLDADGNEISMWSMNAKQAHGPGGESADGGSSGQEDDESDDDESGDEPGDHHAIPSGPGAEEDSREARKGAKKAKKAAAIARHKAKSVQVGDMPSDSEDESSEAEEIVSANPNHSIAARKQATPRQAEDVPATISGPRAVPVSGQIASLEQRKADLERLQGVKKQREADAKFKEVEQAEKQRADETRNAERIAKEADRRANALGKDKKGKQ